MKQLRIVIAEDSAALSNLLSRTLSAIEGCLVVGTAPDGVTAIHLVSELNPNVLVLDISMPLMNGIEALKEIRKRDSSTVIIMFTADTSDAVRRVCLGAGANFFLEKSETEKLVAICQQQLLAS